MKLCIDCKHIREPDNERFEKCHAPQNIGRIDPVYGRQTVSWIYCETHRMNGPILSRMFGQCGRSGRWFEAATHQPAAHAATSAEGSSDAES